MKRLILLTGSALVLTLSGCEDPMRQDAEYAPPVEVPIAPSAEDAATAATDPSAPTDPLPPLDNTQLPPTDSSSEESVQPESETLFY
jgi:PBP1b-binding outer membrane lipoprotein LpoB